MTKEVVMQYAVKDGVRTLKFEGELLAQSSSRIGSRPRWVEFLLFKTSNGVYVVSRIGVSRYYHNGNCSVVSRNRLSAIDESELSPDSIPCTECRPSRFADEGVYPETPRFWAQHSEKPRGIVASLMKYDDNGIEYLTNVARRLLEDAAEVDEGLADAFYTDTLE
jgi:hypothetical protein